MGFVVNKARNLARLMRILISCHNTVKLLHLHSRGLQAFLTPHQWSVKKCCHPEVAVPERTWWSWIGGRTSRDWPKVCLSCQPPRLGSPHGRGHCPRDLEQGGISIVCQPLRIEGNVLGIADLHYLVQSQQVLVKTDNITAKAYINREALNQALSAQLYSSLPGQTHLPAIRVEHLL